jgi:cephalosporin hydroxylase/glycosyltransferase involved in cell wall biosynthesis
MYPFWDPVIAPLVAMSKAQRVVEIGALRGETTAKMLEDLGPDAELHIIDPLPQFDPAEHERRFPGRYIFHRDLSLNVLPHVGAFDVALVDGDHNWYTVYNELQHLREAAREAGRPLPLLILHDVGWPYGRRDLYYEPSQIPEEFRQPHKQRGMTPGRSHLLAGGGMNISLDNAVEEGGERNGVRTALDDFVAEHDNPIRQVILPMYYGLAIVAEKPYLDAHPEVGAFLNELESPEGTARMLELAESVRLDEVVFSHNIERMSNDRLSRANERYLKLLRESLLGAPHIENDDRLRHLLSVATQQSAFEPERMVAPAKLSAPMVRALDQGKQTGLPYPKNGTSQFPHTHMGRDRLTFLDTALAKALADTSTGDFVEVGTGRGGGAIYMRGVLSAHEQNTRTVWVVDNFRAAPPGVKPTDLLTAERIAQLGCDLNQIRDSFHRFDLLDEQVKFLQGEFAETLPGAELHEIAALRIGPSVDPVAALELTYSRVVAGGVVIVDAQPGHDQALGAFLEAHQIQATDRLSSTALAWQKTVDSTPIAASTAIRDRAPLAPSAPTDAIDLSVVVVFYNMAREAERTLTSLTRGYQRDIEDLNYEIIAVENGSDPDQRLSSDFVESFGSEFRLLDLGDDAHPSPTHALNKGISHTRGQAIALMIDGAHLLSPGVLREAMAAMKAYAPSVVATQQWYLGPGQQPITVGDGYDQATEDKLLSGIAWPSDGYRLFEISHFIGERDWFDGMLESNCLFAPRELLEQVGGFDDSFSMPGAGYANLELFERLCGHPATTMTTIVGEGSFHQVHGGTTTNDRDEEARRKKTFAYSEHYREKFGRQLRGPAKQMHFVGRFSNQAARRTRARHLTSMGFGLHSADDSSSGLPSARRPVPDELATSFTDAFWHSLAWQETSWLGEPVGRAPNDLLIYQELVHSIAPSAVVLTTDGSLGVAGFLATVMSAIGHGQVIAVGPDVPQSVDNPRITTVKTDGDDRGHDQVRQLVGDDANCLVILGTEDPAHLLMADFKAFAPLVGAGSYVIFENTIVNGRPVRPDYGPGPLEAIQRLLPAHGEFMQDARSERFANTFNRGGYLRRTT